VAVPGLAWVVVVPVGFLWFERSGLGTAELKRELVARRGVPVLDSENYEEVLTGVV
jgi:hypothetical protein